MPNPQKIGKIKDQLENAFKRNKELEDKLESEEKFKKIIGRKLTQ
jgi:hypothetical protein